LTDLEPRLKPGGLYEMATLVFRDGMGIPAARVRKLVREAIALNERIGDPTLDAKKKSKAKRTPKKR
jgi:hypothetical protein